MGRSCKRVSFESVAYNSFENLERSNDFAATAQNTYRYIETREAYKELG